MLQSDTVLFEVAIIKFEEVEFEVRLLVAVQTITKQYVYIYQVCRECGVNIKVKRALIYTKIEF